MIAASNQLKNKLAQAREKKLMKKTKAYQKRWRKPKKTQSKTMFLVFGIFPQYILFFTRICLLCEYNAFPMIRSRNQAEQRSVDGKTGERHKRKMKRQKEKNEEKEKEREERRVTGSKAQIQIEANQAI